MILMSSLIGGGGLPQLAPDLTFFSDRVSGNIYQSVTVDTSGGMTTVLSLSGRWVIPAAILESISAENYDIEMTIDGVTIVDDTVLGSANGIPIVGILSSSFAGAVRDIPITCNSSFLLRVQSATDTTTELQYLARPIL